MIKILLLSFISASIISFAQGQAPPLNFQLPLSHYSKDTHLKMNDVDWISSSKLIRENPSFPAHHQTLLMPHPIQLMDSVYTWGWDSISNGWITDFKDIGITYDDNNNLLGYTDQIWDKNIHQWKNEEQYFFSYDAHNNLAGNLYKEWNGSSWENVQKNTYTYDLDNNQLTLTQQNWSGSIWENTALFIHIYDINNNLTTDLRQLWNGSFFQNYDQLVYTYDDNNNQTTELAQAWNGLVWENYYLNSSTYNTQNNRITELDQYWNGSEWVNSAQRISNYDENDNLAIMIFQSWNGIDWEEYGQNLYTYDTNNLILNVLSQVPTTEGWKNSNLRNYSYDENNNQTHLLEYNWIGDAWLLYFQYADAYDANNFQLSRVHKRYNDDGTMFPIADSTYYYFHTVIVSADQVEEDQDSISIYPNPSHGQFSISSNSFDKIEIFNLLGEQVFASAQRKSQTNAEIDLAQYGLGIYCVLIHDGQEVYTRKIVIQ